MRITTHQQLPRVPNPHRGSRIVRTRQESPISSGRKWLLILVEGTRLCALDKQCLFLIGCRGMQSASRVQDCAPLVGDAEPRQVLEAPNPCRRCKVVCLRQAIPLLSKALGEPNSCRGSGIVCPRRGVPLVSGTQRHPIPVQGARLCAFGAEYRGWRRAMST